MEGLTRLVLRHRRVVLAAWFVVFLVSGVASAQLAELLTNRFILPGTDTHRVELILEESFGQKATGSFTIVLESEAGAGPLVPRARAAGKRASAVLPTSRLVAVEQVSDDVVLAQLVSELAPADSKGYTDAMREAIGTIPGATVFVTGQAAIERDLDPVFAEDLLRGELIAIPTALRIVWIFANFMELSTYLQNLVSLIGLGIAIDYSLLVVYRFREELRAGAARDDAVVKTMATAGRAVVFSGGGGGGRPPVVGFLSF